MAKNIKCTIVTPLESVLDDEITYASVPAWDGQIGIMAGTSPILVKLASGSLRLDFPEGGSRWYMVDGGFAEFCNDQLSLLSDDAVAAENDDDPDGGTVNSAIRGIDVPGGLILEVEIGGFEDDTSGDFTLTVRETPLEAEDQQGNASNA